MDEKLMSEARQNEILAKVEEAAALHVGGMNPTEALAKVASEAGYNANVLERMVQTFNTAKTLHHMRNALPTEKAASFELADFDQAKAIMFPEDEKQVKAAYFDQPDAEVFDDEIPNFHTVTAADLSVLEVEAKPVPRSRGRDLRQAFIKSAGYKTRARKFRDQAEEHRFTLEAAVGELGDRFKLAGCPINWYEFRREAEAVGGMTAKQVADVIEDQHGLSQRYIRHKIGQAEDWEEPAVIDDTTREHKLMKIACLSAELAAHYGIQAQRWFHKHSATQEALINVGKSWGPMEKRSSLTGSMGLLALRDRLAAGQKKMLEERKPPVITEADLGVDLNIDAEIQKTRAGIALRDMMEEDEVIAQHASENPARVTEMMNDLIAVSPQLINMPIALKAMLRRQLEMGVTEPFEILQMRELSKDPQKYQQGVLTPAMGPRPTTPGSGV